MKFSVLCFVVVIVKVVVGMLWWKLCSGVDMLVLFRCVLSVIVFVMLISIMFVLFVGLLRFCSMVCVMVICLVSIVWYCGVLFFVSRMVMCVVL